MTDQARVNADLAYQLRQLNQEIPSACITLRRTGTVALTAGTGYNVVWQQQTRGFGIDWSTTNITILTPGYYYWHLAYSIQLSGHTTQCEVRVNGARWMYGSSALPLFIAANTTYEYNASGMGYLAAGDVCSVYIVDFTANATLQANAEGTNGASPIFHMMQMSTEIF